MKKILLACMAVACIYSTSAAQDEPKKDEFGWKKGGGFGLDLSGLALVNPRVGAGDNRFGLGGLVSLFANRKQAKSFWDNNGTLQFSTQRIGGSSADFQKNVDLIRMGSRYGIAIYKDKLFFATDATAETQLLPTYAGNVLKGPDSTLLSQFFSPVRFALAPGIDFKPIPGLSFFLAPASLNLIYVGNDELAALAGQPLGNEADKNSRLQLGYTMKVQYLNKFLKERVTLTSKLGWFADYRQSLNGNVLWQNNASIAIFKGLSLDLFGDLFYDHFSKAVIKEVPEGTSPAQLTDPANGFLGLQSSYTGGFLLKFSRTF